MHLLFGGAPELYDRCRWRCFKQWGNCCVRREGIGVPRSAFPANFKIVEVFFYAFFFLLDFCFFLVAEVISGLISACMRYRRFECGVRWVPASTFERQRKKHHVAQSSHPLAPLAHTDLLLDLRASKLMQAQSFQSALPGSATPLALLPAPLHSSPSFPL